MNKTYIETYPHLVAFCSSHHPFNLQSFLQATLMVYGWMPTSLKLKGNLEKSIFATNKLLAIKIPDANLLTVAHESINNSIVGLSKLLHFSKPDVFPIWDSRIAELQFNIKHQYVFNKPQPYIEYFNLIHKTINSVEIAEIRKFAQNKIPYQVTDVRAVEYFIFNGKTVA